MATGDAVAGCFEQTTILLSLDASPHGTELGHTKKRMRRAHQPPRPTPPPGTSELGYQDPETIKRQSMETKNESSQEPPFPSPPPSLFSLSTNRYTSLLASRCTNTGA